MTNLKKKKVYLKIPENMSNILPNFRKLSHFSGFVR